MTSTELIIRVKDHLLIPFGRPKWDISKIRIASVSTDATYFASGTPCAYVDVQGGHPLRLDSIQDSIPEFPTERIQFNEDSNEAAKQETELVRDVLLERCDFDSDFERHFLDLYFRWAVEACTPRAYETRKDRADLPEPRNDPWWSTEALLPLPQAHLYVHDPLRSSQIESPDNMFKVDFAFWTGSSIVAVEVDGKTHIGDERHVTKDRMLQRAGVQVIHILNKELVEHGTKVVPSLLPAAVSRYWETLDTPKGYAVMPF